MCLEIRADLYDTQELVTNIFDFESSEEAGLAWGNRCWKLHHKDVHQVNFIMW